MSPGSAMERWSGGFVVKKILITSLVLMIGAASVDAWAGEKGNRKGGQMDPEHRARMQERLGAHRATNGTDAGDSPKRRHS